MTSLLSLFIGNREGHQTIIPSQILERANRARSIEDAASRAFGDPNYARATTEALCKCLVDSAGLVFLTGSSLSGVCRNPTQPWYGLPFDVQRESDIDIGIIDRELFSQLARSDIIYKPDVIGHKLAGKISYPILTPHGELKKTFQRECFRNLRQILLEIMQSTGRYVDANLCKDRSVLKDGRLSYGVVLADREGLYF